MSVIAARRVVLPHGSGTYTNLFIALCSKSTLFTKTTTSDIAERLLEAAGLDFFLVPNESTPGAFINELTQSVPNNYGEMNDRSKEQLQKKLAFAGQRGWFYEEFGTKVNAMMQENGVMADFRGLLRIFDDCKSKYEHKTLSRGTDCIQKPYLALLANLTPHDLKRHASRGSALWGDGFLARFAFITPPSNALPSNNRFPQQRRIIPNELIQPLIEWHHSLGVPSISIKKTSENSKNTNTYISDISNVQEKEAKADSTVIDAFYEYRGALKALTMRLENDDLASSYGRFANRALRVATLLASLENDGYIDIRHWSRAQHIAEGWRYSLHNLVDEIAQSTPKKAKTLEDRVMRVLHNSNTPFTVRTIAQKVDPSMTEEIRKVLDGLVQKNIAICANQGKTTVYSSVDV